MAIWMLVDPSLIWHVHSNCILHFIIIYYYTLENIYIGKVKARGLILQEKKAFNLNHQTFEKKTIIHAQGKKNAVTVLLSTCSIVG